MKQVEELLKSEEDLAKGRHTAEPKAGPTSRIGTAPPGPDPAHSEAQKREHPYRTDGRKLNENTRKNLKQSPKNDEYKRE